MKKEEKNSKENSKTEQDNDLEKDLISELQRKLAAAELDCRTIQEKNLKLLEEKEEMRRTISNITRSFSIVQEQLNEKESAMSRDVESLTSQKYRKLAKELVEMFDNFCRISEIVDNQIDRIDSKNKEIVTIIHGVHEGFKMLNEKFKTILQSNLEVEEIEVKEGDSINFEEHMELHVEQHRELANRTVYKVVRKGYKYKNSLLRPVLIIANRY